MGLDMKMKKNLTAKRHALEKNLSKLIPVKIKVVHSDNEFRLDFYVSKYGFIYRKIETFLCFIKTYSCLQSIVFFSLCYIPTSLYKQHNDAGKHTNKNKYNISMPIKYIIDNTCKIM